MSIRFSLAVAVAAAMLTLAAGPASATAVRTFVSGKGADGGTCSLAAPCRTFTFALSATTAGGEIVVLDSAGYGAVTINKSVTISNQTGVEGAITVNSGNAITVDLAAAGTVVLKGLTIDGLNAADNGIVVQSSGPNQALDIYNCTIRNFVHRGISVVYAGLGFPNLVRMLIKDTTITGNGDEGVYISPVASAAGIVVSDSVISRNLGTGILISGSGGTANISATFSHVNVSLNGSSGLIVLGMGSDLVTTIKNSLFEYNLGNDVASGGSASGQYIFEILDHNTISYLGGNSDITTDGTNNVRTLNVGTFLTKVDPQ